MITGVLILLIAAFSFRHYEQERQVILFFAATCGLFQVFHDDVYHLAGYEYYLGAAFADYLVIKFISKIKTPTKTISALQDACLYFIYLNLFGWIAYELYYTHIVYNLSCLALFIIILFLSFKEGDKNGVGNSAIYGGIRFVYSADFQSGRTLQKNKTEIGR